jgi:hypothetical protein
LRPGVPLVSKAEVKVTSFEKPKIKVKVKVKVMRLKSDLQREDRGTC